jgi:hypothetical protein
MRSAKNEALAKFLRLEISYLVLFFSKKQPREPGLVAAIGIGYST